MEVARMREQAWGWLRSCEDQGYCGGTARSIARKRRNSGRWRCMQRPSTVREDVERGEQGGDAIADVVVGHGARLRLERQTGLGEIEGLNWLFSSIESTRLATAGRRTADDVLEFGRELGVVGALEAADAVRL